METKDDSNFFRAEADLATVEARKRKAERTKDAGDPIELKGKVIRMIGRGDEVWTAESGGIARRTDVESGKTIRIYRGHTGPVTCITFFDGPPSSDPGQSGRFLITGSWDKTIRFWELGSGRLLSTTSAHSDFIKSLLVIPHLNLLVSGSSDKTIKLWDTSSSPDSPLKLVGSLSSHTRPVECLALDFNHSTAPTTLLYSADSMGVIKIWELEDRKEGATNVRAELKGELNGHRTGITEMTVGGGYVWTSSLDDTVRRQPYPPLPPESRSPPPIENPKAARSLLVLTLLSDSLPYLITGAGDIIRVYELSEDGDADLVGEVDAHWHDVTALAFWMKKSEEGVTPCILSASLDGTIRRWKLTDLLKGKMVIASKEPVKAVGCGGLLTEDEERELAALMEEDEDD